MAKSGNGTRRSIWAVLTLIALLSGLVVASPAGAQDTTGPKWLDRYELETDVEVVEVRPNGRVVVDAPVGRVYGEAGDGYAIIAGGDMLSVCSGEPPPTIRQVLYRRDGAFTVHTLPGGFDVRTYIYKTDLGVFEFFDAVCGGFFENGTPIPAPFASGFATLRNRQWGMAVPGVVDGEVQPAGRYRNTVQGTVADVDGNTFDVFALANYRVPSDGEFDPIRLVATVTPTAG